jgi:hypothetical protein
LGKARGHAQLVFVAAVPAAPMTAFHLISVLRHTTNVSAVLNAALLAVLISAMIVGHVRFTRLLAHPNITHAVSLDGLADAESTVASTGFLVIFLALVSPFLFG